MLQTFYILQFKNGGEFEDMIIYFDRELAFDKLKRSWASHFLFEYPIRTEAPVDHWIACYEADSDGILRRYPS